MAMNNGHGFQRITKYKVCMNAWLRRRFKWHVVISYWCIMIIYMYIWRIVWGPARWHKWLRSSPCMPRIPYGLRSSPAAPLPFQLPACGPGKQSRTAQSFGTLHLRGRSGRVSWLRIGIASAVALTWGVNHQMEDLPLCLSSRYIRLSNGKK